MSDPDGSGPPTNPFGEPTNPYSPAGGYGEAAGAPETGAPWSEHNPYDERPPYGQHSPFGQSAGYDQSWSHSSPGYGAGPERPSPPVRPHPVRNGLVVALVIAAAAGAGLVAGRLSSPSPTTSSPRTAKGTTSSPNRYGYYAPGTGAQPGGSGGSLDTSAIAAKVDPTLVDVNVVLGYEGSSAAGTGIVLTSDGEVLTNNHVVDGATAIHVTDVGNHKTYVGHVIGTDATDDVAVIQLEGARGLKTATLGNSSTVKKGEPIVSLGNAGGVGGMPSTASGSVVGLDKSITATEEGGGNSEHLSGMIETDAPIEPGDSGGPVVDSKDQVLAMDTAALSANRFDSTGTAAYAIPIDSALSIAQQISDGETSSTIQIGTKGMIGVAVVPTDSDGGPSTPGALVEAVVPSSPAAKAGIVVGDVVTSIDGRQVSSVKGLSELMSGKRPKDRVTVGFETVQGAARTVTISLAPGAPA